MKAIAAYLAIVYALSIALSLLIGFTGGHASSVAGLALLTMFMPAIAVLIVYSAWREAPHIVSLMPPMRYVLIALFFIPALMHAVMLPLMATLAGRLHWSTPSPADIARNAVVGVLIVSVLAFFEEIGWRAWLLPRLVDRITPRRAVVVSSILWAIWHVPFQLSGIQYIAGVSPWKLAIVVPIGTMGAGLIIGWLWLRTHNVWLAAIAHGAMNNWGQFAFKYIQGTAPASVDLTVLASGSVAVLLAGSLLLAVSSVTLDAQLHQNVP
jgi:membrane protease YdiL (CAAX protease family)